MLTLKDILKVTKFEEQCSRQQLPFKQPSKIVRLILRSYETPEGDVVIRQYDSKLEQQGYQLLEK